MKEPKDYQLGQRAYEAFWNEQPQVWFSDLGHEFQMRWVRVARAVQEDAKKFGRAKPSGPMTEEDAREIIASAPKQAGGNSDRVDHRQLTKAESERIKQAYQRLKDIREAKK